MKSFIVFEGVDGSGKTTLSKALAERVGAQYFSTPGNEFAQMRAYIDNGTSPDVKLLFYLSSVADASAKIENKTCTTPVVCDRYIWSSLIPHAAYFNRDLDKLERLFSPLIQRLARPTQTILLTLPEEVQLERIRIRQDITVSDKYCLQRETRRKVRASYHEIAQREGWEIIDTSSNNVEAILKELIAKHFQGVQDVTI